MCDPDLIQVHADALALAIKIQAAGGSFETTHEVDGRKVTVNRSPGGQFASSPGGGIRADIKTELKNFGTSLAKTFKLEEASNAIAKLSKDSRAGFERVLNDNPLLKDVSGRLQGATKDGFDTANNLIDKLTGKKTKKGADWKKLPKQFADGVGALVQVQDIKENPQDYLMGLALAGAMTFGIVSALSASSLATALPGVIGEAVETGNITAVGLHLLQLFGKSMWALIVGLIVVPLLGQMVIAKAVGSATLEDPSLEQKAEEEKEKARKKAERAARIVEAAARAAKREQQDPTERKLGYMGIDLEALRKAQANSNEQARQKLKEEVASVETDWTKYMDSAVGEGISSEDLKKMERELALHIAQVKQLIGQRD